MLGERGIELIYKTLWGKNKIKSNLLHSLPTGREKKEQNLSAYIFGIYSWH